MDMAFRNLVLVIGLMMLFCGPLWSLSLFSFPPFSKKQLSISSEKKMTGESLVDFSGYWQGECNGEKVEDLMILHKSSLISLTYGGIKEKYFIGELNTNSISNFKSAEFSSAMVSWNLERNALIFLHSLNFIAKESNANSMHFSKSSMQIEQGNLMITTQYFVGSNTTDPFEQEMINCIYHKK